MNYYNFIYEILAQFGVGIVLWSLSLKFRMKLYGSQPLSFKDFWFVTYTFCISFALWYLAYPLLAEIILKSEMLKTFQEPFFFKFNTWLQVVSYLIVADFLEYWCHRLLHTKALWPHHALHHSPRELNMLSGLRGAPLHILILSLPHLIVGLICFATESFPIFLILIGITAFKQHFAHTSLKVPIWIERVVVTPRYHFVHHHPNPKYTDSNFGPQFTVWDRIFGTYTDPGSIEEDQIGVLGLDYEMDKLSLSLGFELTPRKKRNYIAESAIIQSNRKSA